MRRLWLPTLSVLLLLAPPLARAADWSDARKAFRKAVRSQDWEARRDAFLPLLDHDGAEAAGEILDAIGKEANGAVVFEGIRTLALFQSPGARGVLVASLRGSREPRRSHALLAIAEQESEVGKDLLLELLAGRDPFLAGEAALGLGRKQVAEALDPLLAALGHGEEHVRAWAARGIVRLAGPIPEETPPKPGEPAPKPGEPPFLPEWMDRKKVTDALVDALGATQGAARREILDALERVTGQRYALDLDAWRELKEGLRPGLIRARGVLPPHVFGIPIYGRRIVVIMDTGMRMDEAHPFTTRERLTEVCRVPGGDDIPSLDLMTKRQFAVAHLRRFLLDLPPDAKIELVILDQKARAIFGKLVPATTANRQKAIDALQGLLSSQGGTDTLSALEMALDAGGKRSAAAWTDGPEEVVLVTGSMPHEARVTEPSVIGATAGLQARQRGIRVHAVGIGGHPFALMDPLAELTGGTYLGLMK